MALKTTLATTELKMAKDPGIADDQLLSAVCEPIDNACTGMARYGGRSIRSPEDKNTLPKLISLQTRSSDGDADGPQKDERTLLSPELGILLTSPARVLSAISRHTEGVDRGILLDYVRPLSGITCQVFPNK